MTLVCKSVSILDGIVNPIYGCGVKMTPDINPIYVGLERSCPRDSKNVSYVNVGLVQTCLDLIEGYGVDSVRTQLSLGLNKSIQTLKRTYQEKVSFPQDLMDNVNLSVSGDL